MLVMFLLYIFIYPHFYNDYVDSKLSTVNNYFGFDMFDNATNTVTRPISGFYASSYKKFGFTFGV